MARDTNIVNLMQKQEATHVKLGYWFDIDMFSLVHYTTQLELSGRRSCSKKEKPKNHTSVAVRKLYKCVDDKLWVKAIMAESDPAQNFAIAGCWV